MSNNTIEIGGNATGSFVAGDNNRIQTTVSVPDSTAIRIADELAGLRAILIGLKGTDAGKLSRALDDADEEAKKPVPDKQKIGSALESALRVAAKTSEFAESATKLTPYVKAAVAWLGANWTHLLPMVGL
jgi:hypothetical protein